jgi:hypothetical protein
MSLTIRELKTMLHDLPDTMRVVCAYPSGVTEEEGDFGSGTEVVSAHSFHIESFENEKGTQEVALVISVFDPVDVSSLEKHDSVPPPFVLGED